MAKALVIYYSVYGNTEKIARALAEGIRSAGAEAEAAKIDDVEFSKLSTYDLLAVGSPTQAFGVARPMKGFLERLKGADLKGRKAFAFDTKMGSRLAGSAGKGMEKKLQGLGLTVVKPHVSAVVRGRDGPLAENAEETFRQVGAELAKMM